MGTLEMAPKMLKKYVPKYTKCNGLERNQMVLKEPYTSLILTILPVYLIKLGKMVLKKIQDPLLLPCDGRIEQK